MRKGLVTRKVFCPHLLLLSHLLALSSACTHCSCQYVLEEWKRTRKAKCLLMTKVLGSLQGFSPRKMQNSSTGQTELYLNQVVSSCYCQGNSQLRSAVFFAEAMYFQAPSRLSILPSGDYWSWLGQSLPWTQPSEQGLELWQMFELDELQPRREERKLEGVSAWLIEFLLLPPKIKFRL